MVTSADIREFQRAYKKRFGIELDSFNARTKLELLVRQLELVYQPITKKQLQSINVNEKTNEQSKQQSTNNC
jgi:methylphosphotriester-DNA--protein-cysteine methyltransferase